MTCMQIHQAISARLDGEDPGLDEPTVYAHLAGCADCRAFAHQSDVGG
jgi:predicted anti-sigma-YlaC factor YlaD